MPERAEKQDRKRRRLEKRRGAVAEPLQVASPAFEEDGDGHRAVQEQDGPAAEIAPPVEEPVTAEDTGQAPLPHIAREHENAPQRDQNSTAAFAIPSFEQATPPRASTPIFPDITGSARPHPRSGRSWTGEPVLMALAIVALIVLAIDTYFTVRLNGLSDRLSAVAAVRPGPSVAATADRPWVGPDRVTTVSFAGGGKPVTTMHIVNSGREPALDLRSNTIGSVRSKQSPAPEVPKQKGPLATTGVLFPNVAGILTFFDRTRPLTAQEASDIQSGQDVLWLVGRIDYRDPKGKQHTTTFRYRYNPQLNAFIAAPGGNSGT